jgi:hypothetical protein
MKRLSILLAILVAAAALAFPALAPAHAGPPSSTWHQCKWLGIWSGNRTFTGSVFARANTATYYLVRIKPSWPFGWSGTGQREHACAHPHPGVLRPLVPVVDRVHGLSVRNLRLPDLRLAERRRLQLV